MANIKVNDMMNLNPTGTDLFNDPESFMIELSGDDESMGQILGMCAFTCGGIYGTCPGTAQELVAE